MNSALIIIFAVLLLAIYSGIRAQKGKEMTMEQWTVGGRGFGSIFIFLLVAGEIYTTFTFLGGSGWAYSKGAPSYYVLSYIALAYVISYWLLPPIWRYAKQHRLVSQSDFFVSKYNSPILGILVAAVGVIAIIPYLILQFKGLGIIVSEASYGSISPAAAVWIGVIGVTIYVMISGIHGSAWTAAIKDILIFFVVVFMGLYLPFHYYGGIKPMFEAVEAANPGFLTFPDEGLSVSWYISTVLVTVFGFYMWPHTFGSVFSAKNENVFRKNTVMLPLYTIMLLFVFFVGFTAILQVPGLKGADGDLSLLRLSLKTFDPWIVGVIGAAGLLTALVPGSMLLMTAATLLAKNVYKVMAPAASEARVAKVAKLLVPVLSLISLYFTLSGGDTLVTLLLMGYSLVTQLFPALLFSLHRQPWVNKYGAFAGITAGVLTVAYVTISKVTIASVFPNWPAVIQDLNIGVIALLVNIIVMFGVTFVTRTLLTTGRHPANAEGTPTI
ncbi:sodium:solute symporter family protein [Brevibacillus centrosporus]|uniref:Solute:Na+ symporter, SSS family n=1 Tax=Brevibacillus centrosporus TaxID=54910 RepID=A0A1I3Z408_9BACL|nr:sodium:solute symporter [Brevibacillus centrosporus]MEC2127635.1 sodium:solute symporter [Brevibacillus centrosporus]MED1950988.1 sodium:solute symporter [Brevibacillus centrosporus]RNB66975.1 sodium:solute symporter family protein [Brevibacillus centrosporus]SFK38787.1 solute:Na+ symporter, SSS family [Brevibacillus centrosporus]GED34705.1 sodium:solute symporter [Brevibacillus centrosporus]